MRYIRLLIIIIFSIIIKFSLGQNATYPGLVQLNPYVVNPAAISSTENLEMMLCGSYFETYIENKNNMGFTADARYSPKKTSSSLMLRYNIDYEHKYRYSEDIRLGYAYQYSIKENRSISAGVSLSHYDYEYDFTVFDLPGTDYQKFTGDGLAISPGILIKINRFSISASSRLHFNVKNVYDYELKEDLINVQTPFWAKENITIAHKIRVSPSVELKPYIRYIAAENHILSYIVQEFWDYEYGCRFRYKSKLESGAGFTMHSFYLYSRYQVSNLVDVAAMLSYKEYDLAPLRVSCQLGFQF
ncbi:MAG: type IX secretion system membrane protein PorP/SprF [Bacteroidales bacterium]|nr:type IX secretion system membrane protein PorP/SprF [Bacteroidales bacterium]MCF8328331.1 type IX secretion system membrane protein PorP/SprF [Bacteroidales bacterium]